MLILAIDTSARFCSVCVYDAAEDVVLSKSEKDIGKGHAEILMAEIDQCLASAEVTYSDLNTLAATRGPGSFTGVRVGLAAIRGLALALELPAIGISSLDAHSRLAMEYGHEKRLCTVLDARRGEVYAQMEDNGPFLMTIENLDALLGSDEWDLCGAGALLLNEVATKKRHCVHAEAACPIQLIARMAAELTPESSLLEPLYLRGADAKPQAGSALERN